VWSYSGISNCYIQQNVNNLTSGIRYQLDLYGSVGAMMTGGVVQTFPAASKVGHIFGAIDVYSGGFYDHTIETPKINWLGDAGAISALALKSCYVDMPDDDKVVIKLHIGGTPTKYTYYNIDDVNFYNYQFSGQNETINNGASVDFVNTTFDWFELSNETIATALDKIAKRTSCNWWVDKDAVLWFKPSRTDVNKVYYENKIESLTLEEDITNIKNRGLLVGGQNKEAFFHVSGVSSFYWSGISPDLPSGEQLLSLETVQSVYNNNTEYITSNLYIEGRVGQYRWVGQTFQWDTSKDLSQVGINMTYPWMIPGTFDKIVYEMSICDIDVNGYPNDSSRLGVSYMSGLKDFVRGSMKEFNFEFKPNINLTSGDIYSFVLKILSPSSISSEGVMFSVYGNLDDNYSLGSGFYKDYTDDTWHLHTDFTWDYHKLKNLTFKLYTGSNYPYAPFFMRERKLRETFQDIESINVYGESQYQIRDESVVTPYYSRLLLSFENDKYSLPIKKGELNLDYGDFDIGISDLVDIRGIISRSYNPGTLYKESGIYNSSTRQWEYDTTLDDNIITFDCLRLSYDLSVKDGCKTNIMINYKRPLYEDMFKDIIDRIKNNERPLDTKEYWDYIIEKIDRPVDTRQYKDAFGLQIRRFDSSHSLLSTYKI
jgi:hypothetical protein